MSSVASLVETALRNGLNIGVGVKSLSADGFSELEVRSTESEFSAPHGWYLDIERFGPLSFLKFSFDDFAKDLNELYAERLQIVKLELESSIDRLSGNGFKFSWHCGSVETTLEDLTEKPPAGKIALAATHREISEDGSPDQLIIPSVSKFLALCLLPLVPDQSPIDTSTSEGFPEGSFEIVKINRYERSSRNRLASIAFYGTHCQVNSFTFITSFRYLKSDQIIELTRSKT
jgi:hypothetical protein